MKSLGQWQVVSFISRGVAMALGLVQSFVIIRILSVDQWGNIQLAMSIGAALGIYQHLGLASASTREISASRKDTDIFKIFSTSFFVRYLITIPLSVGLFLAAGRIASTYKAPEILIPLKIYAVTLLCTGVQSILNSVIAGTKRFKALFIFQAVVSFVSVCLYIPLVYFYNILGYFYAYMIFTIISATTLFIIAFKPYFGYLKLPTKKEFKTIFKELFSLGMAIYFVKIIFMNWEKFGTNILGFEFNAQTVGVYAFALLYAKKLMYVSDAVTDVNLPVFSEKFERNMKSFCIDFSRNFNKIYVFVLFSAFSAIFWVYEFVQILVGSDKYNDSLPLIFPMVFAFIFYALLNIIKSSVAIPAKLNKEMVFGFLIMIITTAVSYFVTKGSMNVLFAMSYSMALGSLFGFIYLVLVSQSRLKFIFMKMSHVLLLIQALVISMACNNGVLWVKLVCYVVLSGFFVWASFLAEFISKLDLLMVFNNLRNIIKGKNEKV